MQDTHLPEGLFGYFPCCTLSAMHAAQGLVAAHRLQPDSDARAPRVTLHDRGLALHALVRAVAGLAAGRAGIGHAAARATNR